MNTQDLLKEVKKSKKATMLCDEALARICAEESQKYKKQKAAVKAAKSRIHAMHGAFFPDGCHDAAARILESEDVPSDPDEQKEFCKRILGLHVSTRERLPVLEDFYSCIFSRIGQPKSIMDIGCGFNPFAIPWTDASLTTYYAYDIDARTIGLVNSFFAHRGMERSAVVLDAALAVPEQSADAAFLFKLAPILEQQHKGRAFELIGALNAKYIVVTFPAKSMSGREKGMAAHYDSFVEEGLPRGLSINYRTIIGNELVYILINQCR